MLPGQVDAFGGVAAAGKLVAVEAGMYFATSGSTEEVGKAVV